MSDESRAGGGLQFSRGLGGPLLWLLRVLGYALLGWSAVYAVSAYDLYLMLARYSDVGVSSMLREFAPQAVIWTLLTPGVVLIYRELDFTEGRRARSIGWHLLISLVFLASLALLELVRMLWKLSLPSDFIGEVISNYANLRMLQHGVNYWLIIAVVMFSDFYVSVRSGERQAQRLRNELARAQLEVLRSKLQPHFLFNAFNSISSLVRSGQNQRAVKLLSDVGTLLRQSLESDYQAEVSLGRELEFIECYLEVEKTRFPERLHYTREVPTELLEAQVPGLILQPLVENAVKHGISQMAVPGLILLRVRAKNGVLEIELWNSTEAASQETKGTDGVGVGQTLTRERMLRLFGKDGVFETNDETPSGGGYSVSLRMPLKFKNR